MVKLLDDNETREILKNGRIGRLGCIADDYPYVLPLAYIIEDDRIYSHSLPGRKIVAMRANPKVCFQVDEARSDFAWRSAIAYGLYEEIADSTERSRVLRALFERFPNLTPVESTIAGDAMPPATIVFSIKIQRLTGVAEKNDIPDRNLMSA